MIQEEALDAHANYVMQILTSNGPIKDTGEFKESNNLLSKLSQTQLCIECFKVLDSK